MVFYIDTVKNSIFLGDFVGVVSKTKEVISAINWKLIFIFLLLPFLGELLDSIPAYMRENKISMPYKDFSDILELFLELAVLLPIGVYISYRRAKENDTLEALKKTEEVVSAITETAKDAIIMIDHNENISYWNPGAQNIFGYAKDEILGKNAWEVLAPERSRKAHSAGFQQFQKSGEGRIVGNTVELPAMNKDGTEFQMELSAAAMKVGDTWSVVAVVRDITERKISEHALKESEERFRSIYESSPIGIVITDKNGKYQVASPAFCTMLGYTEDEFKEVSFKDISHPAEVEENLRLFQEMVDGKRDGYRLEKRYYHKDGSIIWGDLRTSPIYDEDGNFLYNFALVNDITEKKQAAQEMEESEKSLAEAQRIARVGNWTYNLSDGTFKTSDETLRILGIPVEENDNPLKYELFLDNLHPDDREEVDKTFKESVENREPYSIDYRIVLPDGTKRYVFAQGVFQEKSSDEGTTIMSGIVQDITERKRAETMLANNLNFLENLLNTIPNPIFFKDVKGRYLGGNNAWFDKIIGLPQEAVIGRTLHELPTEIPKDLADKYHDMDMELINNPGIQTYDSKVQCADGIRRDFLFNKATFNDVQGNVAGLVGVMLDLSSHKDAENALKISEDKYKTVFNNSSDAIFISNLKGAFIEVNDIACERLGYSKKELLAMAPSDINPPESAAEIERRMRIINETGYMDFETEHISKDNKHIPVNIVCRRIDYAGEDAVLAVARDISEQKQAAKQHEKIEHLESLGVLAGGIAHDFNNLLGAILSSVELAARGLEKDSKHYSYLAEGQEAVLRAKDLTEQLLTFSKGGAPLRAPESIEKIIKDTAEFVLHGSKTKINYLFDGNLDFADIDAGQISQVIQNLVINADQAMPQTGVISIRAENEELTSTSHVSLKPGEYVKVTIKDQGIGIPKKHLKNIFDPYFSTKQKGSGLGLSIVYSIINAHDGDITVESALGQGTTFIIHLPATQKTYCPIKEDVITYSEGNGERILLLEDDENVGRTMAMVLSELGYKPKLVFDGEEAVKEYRHQKDIGTPYDLLITDLTIPGGLGGEEVCRLIQEIDPDAKAIASSGYANDPVMANYTNYGFAGVLKKPVKLDEIGYEIHNVLKK